jgi:N-acetylglucosaminyldiphosphoundecaprenol N-acetyl-beta-D-mannosaminyltransferase
MDQAVALADASIKTGRSGYICVTGVHGVMEAQGDAFFQSILNAAVINVPDGMPLSWIGRMRGFGGMNRVYGPDFLLEMCKLSVGHGYRNFFYGGNEGVAPLLAETLQQRFLGLQVVGTYTPPFRLLNAVEEAELLSEVHKLKPDILWVGLSTPKQERFMAAYLDQLGVPLLVGVGAAFDIHTGRIQDAPTWMKKSGLQWLHRLLQEPRRLGRRYLVNNPKFLYLLLREALGLFSASKPTAKG